MMYIAMEPRTVLINVDTRDGDALAAIIMKTLLLDATYHSFKAIRWKSHEQFKQYLAKKKL